MYRMQVKLQRLICFLALAAGVILFIYALGLMTDLFMLKSLISDENKLDISAVPTVKARIYYDMQDFNEELLMVAICAVVLSVLLFITNTQSRRKYYISNYIASGINVAAEIAIAIWVHIRISYWKAQYKNNVNFGDLEAYLKRRWERPDSRTKELTGKTPFTDSMFWFDVHYFICALAIAASVLLIANIVWKIVLMRRENKLLEGGKAVY